MATTVSSIVVVLFLFSISSVYSASHHHAAAPAPSADCMSVIINLADCLSFVSVGGTTTKPEGTCCSGLKTILKTNPECLCEGFKNSASFGVTLNMTRATALPSACKLHAPSIANCGLSIAPTASVPALAPGGVAAAGPGSAEASAPNPSPGGGSNDGSSLIPISFTTIFSILFFVLFASHV